MSSMPSPSSAANHATPTAHEPAVTPAIGSISHTVTSSIGIPAANSSANRTASCLHWTCITTARLVSADASCGSADACTLRSAEWLVRGCATVCDSDARLITIGGHRSQSRRCSAGCACRCRAPIGDGYVTRPLEHLKPYVQPSSSCANLRQHLACLHRRLL